MKTTIGEILGVLVLLVVVGLICIGAVAVVHFMVKFW